ncbi:MAG: 8-oxo-dGTP diphosphatase [Oscillospiraceae bacterium]|nr:8-oxo-dGTP diphosphatase [Oscillospiraceae bacterium]
MPQIELTNMVMIYDDKGRALVQERVKSWKGISFPGGHVEPDESFMASAIREVREETGLTVTDLQSCGIIHWLNTANGDRYLVFLYKTNKFSGKLLPATDEGRVFWMDIQEILKIRCENGFHKYFPMFFENKYSEMFGPWSETTPEEDFYL